MHFIARLAAVAAAVSTLAIVPPAVASEPHHEATQLRKLDIMLMVSSLRCRFGPDNFQPDYTRFSTNHYPTMQGAFKQMEAHYTQRMGVAGARKAIDKVSVGMANQYGQGHPWMGCSELKAMTRQLAATKDRAHLVAAAHDALADRPATQIALRP